MADDQTTAQDPTIAAPATGAARIAARAPGPRGGDDPPADHGEETYRGSGRLEGRRALITGGDSGIGRAVAIAFAREGADVLISHLPEEQEDARGDACRLRRGRRAHGVISLPGDIAEEAHCREIVERAVAELGGIDILVNNAAVPDGVRGARGHHRPRSSSAPSGPTSSRCSTPARRRCAHMQPGATIINTASDQAYEPVAVADGLCGDEGGDRQLHEEPRPGRCSSAASASTRSRPGPIWTPLIPATMPPEKVKTFGEDTPMGRAGQPAEVAPGLRLPRLAGVELHHRRGHRRHRRQAAALRGKREESPGPGPRPRARRCFRRP